MFHRLKYRLTIPEMMNIRVARVKPVSAILSVCPHYATASILTTASIFTNQFRTTGCRQRAETSRIINIFTQKMDRAIGKQEVASTEMHTAEGIRVTAINALICDQ